MEFWKFYFDNGILKIKFGNWNFEKLNLRIGTLENYFENEISESFKMGTLENYFKNEILENLKNWSFRKLNKKNWNFEILFENGSLKKIIWKLKFWKLNSKIGILKISFENSKLISLRKGLGCVWEKFGSKLAFRVLKGPFSSLESSISSSTGFGVAREASL